MFCFHHFCNSTSKQLAGPFESSLWTRLIPQACQSNLSIRHAVISIATLSLIPGISCSFTDQQAELYHRFALQHYSKAVQEMRNDTVSGSQDIRSALIACLVIICFEAFYGNHESALNQLGAGLGLINTWFENRTGGIQDSTKSVSTASAIIDNELIQAYARLDVHVLMLARSRRMENRITMTNTILQGTHIMPQCFLSIEEARIYIGSIQRRLLGFLKSDSGEAILTYRHLSSDNLKLKQTSLLTEREDLLDNLIQWHVGFDPILQRVRSTKEDKEFRAALILHLQYLTTYFTVSSLPNKTPLRRRDFMPLFAEMISLARSVLQHPDTQPNTFTFNAQTIKPLYTVACQCPNSTLRRQAISMLLLMPRREGFWDSVLSGKLAQWIMVVEEEDLDGDYVPEETKIRSLSVSADLQQRRVQAECLKPEKGYSERLVRKSTLIIW